MMADDVAKHTGLCLTVLPENLRYEIYTESHDQVCKCAEDVAFFI